MKRYRWIRISFGQKMMAIFRPKPDESVFAEALGPSLEGSVIEARKSAGTVLSSATRAAGGCLGRARLSPDWTRTHSDARAPFRGGCLRPPFLNSGRRSDAKCKRVEIVVGGGEDGNDFARQFRARMGKNPREWRAGTQRSCNVRRCGFGGRFQNSIGRTG
jgi:hypothetical protein